MCSTIFQLSAFLTAIALGNDATVWCVLCDEHNFQITVARQRQRQCDVDMAFLFLFFSCDMQKNVCANEKCHFHGTKTQQNNWRAELSSKIVSIETISDKIIISIWDNVCAYIICIIICELRHYLCVSRLYCAFIVRRLARRCSIVLQHHYIWWHIYRRLFFSITIIIILQLVFFTSLKLSAYGLAFVRGLGAVRTMRQVRKNWRDQNVAGTRK